MSNTPVRENRTACQRLLFGKTRIEADRSVNTVTE